MKTLLAACILLASLALVTACADYAVPASGNAGYDLEIAKGRATSAAIETVARRAADAIATNDARTRIASEHASTLAAQAQRNAMLYAQATSTAQSQYAIATATAQYVIARAAETTQAESARFNATQTVRAADATATADVHRWQTTATAERRTLEAEQARVQATATAQAIDTQIKQAQADEERNAQIWNAIISIAVFLAVILLVLLAIALAVIIFQGAFALSQMFAARAEMTAARAAQQLVIETRAGTVILNRTERGTYVPSIVSGKDYGALPSADDFNDLQAKRITATAQPSSGANETFKYTNGSGTTHMTKEDPDADRKEQDRKLCMDLIRASMEHWRSLHHDPKTCTRIATWRDLEWSAATWQRAVNLLRPHIITVEGRGGGTLCGKQYPTLLDLYVALGERRIALAETALNLAYHLGNGQ